MDYSPKGEGAGASESIEVHVIGIFREFMRGGLHEIVPGGNRTHI